jgi:hypothetical protein
MTFSLADAIALAFMTFLLVLGAQAVRRLWNPSTAPDYVNRLRSAFPWASKASIRRFAAAAPSVVVAMAGLVLAVTAALIGAADEANTTVVAFCIIAVAIGLGAFCLGLLVAVSVSFFGRPRAVVPPPLRPRDGVESPD